MFPWFSKILRVAEFLSSGTKSWIVICNGNQTRYGKQKRKIVYKFATILIHNKSYERKKIKRIFHRYHKGAGIAESA
jgi:hypothetical protein